MMKTEMRLTAEELEKTFDIYEEGDEAYLFVSYSHEDRELVMKILNYLVEEKYRIWYDRGIATEGEMNFVNVIEEKIKKSSGVIVFISPYSMNSNYCGQEIMMSYRHHKEIYPLALTEKNVKELIPSVLQTYLSENKHISVVDDFENDTSILMKFLRFLPEKTRQCIVRDAKQPEKLRKCKDGNRKIDLDSDIKIICPEAFKGCKKLEKITLNQVQVIGDEAFLNCESLKEINIPKTVKYIGEYAFKDCERVEKLTFEDDYKEGTLLIGDGAFDGCINLKDVMLPHFLTELPSGLFNGCSNIKKISWPQNLITLGESVFEGCKNLSLVDSGAFPESLKKIDDQAFVDCDNLEKIAFPDGLKKIGKNVFKDCGALKKISIGKEVSFIGTSPFRGCKKLRHISVSPKNKYFKASGNVLFNKNRSTLICYPADCIDEETRSYMTQYNIPDSVTVISDWAFAECTHLKKIVIPDSVDEIGENAFYKCKNIETIEIPDGVVKIDDMAFRGCTSLKKIIIPNSVVQIGWALFSGCQDVEIICEENSPVAVFYSKTNRYNMDVVRLKYTTEGSTLN